MLIDRSTGKPTTESQNAEWCPTVKDYEKLIKQRFGTQYLGDDFWAYVVKPTLEKYERNGLNHSY